MKQCPRCSKSGVGPKPESAFSKSKQTPDGLFTYCRSCKQQFEKERQAKNPAKFLPKKRARDARYREQNAEKVAARSLKNGARRYGIPEPTRVMPDNCESCGDLRGTRRFHRDHCHTQKVFRGWLCSKCNMAAGLLQEDPAKVDKLAAYLRR